MEQVRGRLEKRIIYPRTGGVEQGCSDRGLQFAFRSPEIPAQNPAKGRCSPNETIAVHIQ